jgi:aspartyl-tRNA(Asn)/glutamyl-tRNA(Gln) amidotransferase subunit A
MALSWSLDKIGPLVTSAEDAWLVLQAVGDDSPLPLLPDHRSSGFRFGVLGGAVDGAEPSVAENARRAIAALGEIGTVEEISLPDYPWAKITTVVLWAEESAAFEEFVESGQVLELAAPEDRVGMLHGMALPAIDYLRALRIRKRAAVEVDALLARFDAVVAPSYSVVAPPLDGSFDAYFDRFPAENLSAMGNLLGLPSISLPTGTGERGLPTSIELLGRAWSEPAILAAARAFQSRTEWHRLRPPSAG